MGGSDILFKHRIRTLESFKAFQAGLKLFQFHANCQIRSLVVFLQRFVCTPPNTKSVHLAAMTDSKALFAYTTASAYYDHFTPKDAVVHIISSYSAEESFAGHEQDNAAASLEPKHASEVETCFFDPPSRGFVVARIIDNARKLSLQWCSISVEGPNDSEEVQAGPYDVLDAETEHAAVHFLFPDRIVPQIMLEKDEKSGTLFVVALTEAGSLYRMAFPDPWLFYANPLPQDYVQSYQVKNLYGPSREPVLMHALGSESVLIATTDGTLIKCTQDRIGENDRDTAQKHSG